MRGVSPIISVVIMIAVVIMLGAAISSWIGEDISKQTSSWRDCSVYTKYEITNAKFKSSTNQTLITVINKGIQQLYGFSLQFENGTDLQTVTGVTESPATNTSSKLDKGKSVSITYTCIGNYNRTLGRTMTWLKVINTACPQVPAETTKIKQIG